MLKFEGRSKIRGEINLIPLINIVFLLLIFFLLTSSIQPVDVLDVAVPEAASGRAAEDRPIVILIGGDGRFAVNGRVVGLDELGERIAALAAETEAPAVRLKADAGARTADLLAAMARVHAAGVSRVGLATQTER